MFIIETNKTTWEHQVTLDPEYDIVEDPDLDSDDELTLNQKLKSMEHFLRLSSGPMVAEINENEKHAKGDETLSLLYPGSIPAPSANMISSSGVIPGDIYGPCIWAQGIEGWTIFVYLYICIMYLLIYIFLSNHACLSI